MSKRLQKHEIVVVAELVRRIRRRFAEMRRESAALLDKQRGSVFLRRCSDCRCAESSEMPDLPALGSHKNAKTIYIYTYVMRLPTPAVPESQHAATCAVHIHTHISLELLSILTSIKA